MDTKFKKGQVVIVIDPYPGLKGVTYGVIYEVRDNVIELERSTNAGHYISRFKIVADNIEDLTTLEKIIYDIS